MMLILNRKPGESITIDDNINIKILDGYHGSIRVGIEAPKHIKIIRDELLNKDYSKLQRRSHEITKP